METVKIDPEFLLRAANLELTKVNESVVELTKPEYSELVDLVANAYAEGIVIAVSELE